MGALRAFGIAVTTAVTVMSIVYTIAIRRRLHRLGAYDSEVAAAMTGEEMIPRPSYMATQAISIAAEPEEVWPWLVQVGTGRAGWYSYDLLENLLGLKIESADRIIPELQHLQVGDAIPIAPGRGFTVESMSPPHEMVWAAEDFTVWSWRIYKDGNATRLVLRSKVRYQWTPAWAPWNLLLYLGPGESIMAGRMLRGIKERAEGRHAAPRSRINRGRSRRSN